ncbi:hypothetical protein ELAN_27530 [Elizabethkingia anophelis]|uniref:hypothetical protein n=1 Tax=Elizabethkingia anophelis TaxID=1117645 RepID=UPI0023E927EA|nr:hypothetical protein [Elizabethkingia anophelis]GJN59198.1 hypothetical protein ELAN_27530 [Elizabethkingia anophelis]
MNSYLNFGEGKSPSFIGKYTKEVPNMQEKVQVYSDLANQSAVQTEIGDVLLIFHEIITESLREVYERQGAEPLKYKMTGMFATDLNATIKAKIFTKLDEDSIFNSKVRVKYNHTSPFFIVKDKYAVFIKKLTGKMNKPQCYPTINSSRTFSGDLFVGNHIPFLFVGPNPKKGDSSYVTSLISRKEVNWTTESTDLFNYESKVSVNLIEAKEPELNLDNVSVNKDLLKEKKKID